MRSKGLGWLRGLAERRKLDAGGGSGQLFGRVREEGRGLTREVRLGLAVVVDCEEGLRLRKEKRERPAECFRRPKTSDV